MRQNPQETLLLRVSKSKTNLIATLTSWIHINIVGLHFNRPLATGIRQNHVNLKGY